MTTSSPKTGLALLREPFTENQIGLLPKPVKKGAMGDPKFNCKEGHAEFRRASVDGRACGGWHAPSIHLDYVGHAALTDRLLDADSGWYWEPLAIDDNGLPKFDNNGGLWMKLTVLGVTRLGYGDSQGKTGPNAVKEAIGDGLRNAGMRFGIALDLWHKGDLHDTKEEQGAIEQANNLAVEEAKRDWLADASKLKSSKDVVALWREAKQLLGADDTTVTALAGIARSLKDAEEASAPEGDPVESAKDAVARGFGG